MSDEQSERPKAHIPDFHEIADAKPCREFRVIFEGGMYEGRTGVLPFLPSFITLDSMDWWKDHEALAAGKYKTVFNRSKIVYMLELPDDKPDDWDGPFVYRETNEVSFERYWRSSSQ